MRIKSRLVSLALSLCVLLTGCAAANQQAASSRPRAAASAVSSEASSQPASSASSAPVSASSEQAPASSGGAASSRTSETSRPASSQVVPASSAQQPAAQTVTLTVDASKGKGGVPISGLAVSWQAGDTAYSILKRGCGQKKVALYAPQSGAGVYVKSIAGVAEAGGQTGWIYKVDNTFPGKAADQVSVGKGQTVTWMYTTDMGRSEGAPLG